MKTFLQFFLLVDYVRDADLELELLMWDRIGTFFYASVKKSIEKVFQLPKLASKLVRYR